MWKVILILILVYNQSEINIVYSSPQSYASLEACNVALDAGDQALGAWLDGKINEFLELPVDGEKDLTTYCSEVTDNEQPI